MWQSQFAIFILIPQLLLVSGLVRRYSGDKFDNDLDVNEYTGRPNVRLVNGLQQENPLWVLRLGNDDFDDLKLRIASIREEQDFYYAFVPLIKRLEARKGGPLPKPISKKLIPRKPNRETEKLAQREVLKNEIMKIVNKFALSTNKEPDSYLTESDDKEISSLALYFKGPYTSLIVTLGQRQWHYFLTPSPFPGWFYEVHAEVKNNEKDIYVDVPDNLKNEFYEVLLKMIHVFLGFPI
ncbi:unnamed protein product [Chilo suppressalis]|uniref:Uncharacterized protein n=1 Tax=Chilo suppressalis TaxID=168631 RepID=A0ABN8B2H1_CHISP|nr:unnamed protein product [Chilo suppressalis]